MRDTDVIEHITGLCKERGWTYYRLAKESELPYSTINNMIHRTNIPTIPTLQKMCDAFGITLSDFFLDKVEDFRLTRGQQELLEVFQRLSKDDKKILMAYGKGLAKIMD
ncbi:helix-turn-helix domain-containing protein [Novisyntrophococcus fermenticellae]|uniref:helix-turn-helix domain-containing protein n=1 Tax=Novisyntrophococcus fermenticellae TaxID=2068655 RepID=UPI001E326CA7|nr:helix-turn-helix transcriptional regulator [Novisyntrophococcus fermenticellae]